MEGATREACRAAKQCVTLALRSGICVEEELANLACAYLLAGETGCAIATAREVAASPRSEVRLSALWCLAVALMFSDRIADAREPITQFFEVVEAHLAWAKLSVFADMCALFAAGEQRFADAARLVGFADAAYSSIGRRLSLPVKARELAWTAIRAGLDDATICACLAEGKNLRRGDVVRLTLGPAARAGARELIVPNAHERA